MHGRIDGMDQSALAELVSSLPDGVVVTDPDTTEKYRVDRSQDAGAGLPAVVVRAEDATHVQTAVRWAARHRVPVVPRGAGSGLSGGSSAVDGGLVLSLERMRAIEIDTDCQVAVVEPGAFNAEVKAAAAEHGLWYPPDPSSYEFCSIGGNIATNAGGLCCVKYGVTVDYVLGLDVVLADGRTLHTGGAPRAAVGPDLTQLFVGSEGTLGIVTRAILRLVPAQPARSTMVATFPTVEAAARAVVAVRRSMPPSMLELMDRASINAVEDYRPRGLDRSAGALLVAQSDAPGVARSDEVELMRTACEAAGATEVFVTDDADEGEMFVEARRIAIPAIEATGALLMLEDVGAPVPLLPALLAAIEEVAAAYDIRIPVIAHAGDGNTHPIVVYEAGDAEAEKRAQAAFREVMQRAIDLGGTITGEHGVGRTKKELLPAQLGPDVMALTRRIKDALDPDGILNPGAVL